MEEGQKFIHAAMKDLKKKEKSEIERLKAENARLRYELELLKNPAEKHLHDQLSKAVGDSLNDKAAEEIARLREALDLLQKMFDNSDSGIDFSEFRINALSVIINALEQ